MEPTWILCSASNPLVLEVPPFFTSRTFLEVRLRLLLDLTERMRRLERIDNFVRADLRDCLRRHDVSSCFRTDFRDNER